MAAIKDGKLLLKQHLYLRLWPFIECLKELGGIQHDIHLISPIVIEPIQVLKVNMGKRNPRLHTDEILMALSICAATNPTMALAPQQLLKLML